MERYTFMSDGYYAIDGEECFDDQDENYCGPAIDKLAYYEDLEGQGRLLILPEDGMLYHLEESETMKWIGNKPIQDIVFKCGWGLVSLEYHLCDLGKKFFLSRKEGEDSIKNVHSCNTCYANDMKYDEVDNPCWNCKGDNSEWMPKKL